MGNPRNRARKTSRKRRAVTKETVDAKRQKCTIEIAETTNSGSRVGAGPSHLNDGETGQTYAGLDATPLSRSRRKLGDMMAKHSCKKEIEYQEENNGFFLFDSEMLSQVFESLCCPVCKNASIKLTELSMKRKGFRSSWCLTCNSCAWEKEFTSSKSVNVATKRSSEVNVRMVMAFRNIGCGLEAMTAFSMMMNMQKAMTRDNYSSLINNIHSAYLEEAEASMKFAAEEDKSQSESNNITASFDGTWQKPGHASLNGVVSAVSILSGKVVDYQVKSKYCKACQRKSHLNRESLAYLQWQIQHQSKCSINHEGSSGAMEVDGLREIFHRSVEKYGARYTTFIGDGDSSSYATIAEEKPYGPDVFIEKKECVGHVQKRLGTRLRKLKASFGNRKLKDGKSIGGKGRLTNKIINKMQNYYGLAIRKNRNNLKGMTNDVMAGLYHIASSDADPQHSLCPKGNESWCAWQRAQASRKKDYKHKSSLPKAIVDEVMPIYKDLSEQELLSRCLDSYTQNPNESLNKLIWARCSKKIYQGKKVVELCTASAVCQFNDGASSIARVLQRLGICPGKFTNAAIQKCDERRIALSDKKSSDKVKQRRKKLRAIKKGLWDQEKEKEGQVYQSGAH